MFEYNLFNNPFFYSFHITHPILLYIQVTIVNIFKAQTFLNLKNRMAIILLILKPFMTILSLNGARQRDGQAGIPIPTFGNWNPTNQGRPQYSENFQSTNAPNYGGAAYQDQS